jgi:uncharacterized RmlC-like cupin family protein
MTGRLIEFPTKTDHRGSLSIVEAGRDCPFPIERVFYLHGAPAGAKRGEHAHRQLEQLIVVVRGEVTVTLDDGADSIVYVMNTASTGLYVPPMHWTRLEKFEAGTVVMVLASAPFDEPDYILTYAEFTELTRGTR